MLITGGFGPQWVLKLNTEVRAEADGSIVVAQLIEGKIYLMGYVENVPLF